MKADDRKKQILTAALAVAAEGNYMTMTRGQIAERAGVPSGLVGHYLGNMRDSVRLIVMETAVEWGYLQVIAQGLGARDPIAMGAPDDLKAAAIETLKH